MSIFIDENAWERVGEQKGIWAIITQIYYSKILWMHGITSHGLPK